MSLPGHPLFLRLTLQLSLVQAALEPVPFAISVIQFCTYRNLSLRLLSISVTGERLALLGTQPVRQKYASARAADDVHLTSERHCGRVL